MYPHGEEGDLTTAKAIQNLGRDIQDLKTELKQELMDLIMTLEMTLNRSSTFSRQR